MTDQSRPVPKYNDVATPSVVNSTLFDNANTVHNSLDAWVPPTGIQLITIAGWGDPTLATLKYKDAQTVCTQYAFNGSCKAFYLKLCNHD